MEFHHLPVLLDEVLSSLDIREEGTYVDGTLGGAGHTREIYRRLGPGGRVFGIDRDEEAIAAATRRMEEIAIPGGPVFRALRGNFHDVKALLANEGVTRIDGALLDLGVSSHQLDEGARGFSYHADAPLDMRMDQSQSLSARVIVNEWSEAEIARILKEYGEENWAAQIARVLCDRRKKQPIDTTAQLVDIIDAAIPRKLREKDGSHPARRTFQALRIAVNDELAPLSQAIRDFVDLLSPGGRLCVIAFHSLEDRVVKNTFRELNDPCVCPKSFPVCVCGRKPSIRLITRKPITASEQELSDNPRSRSATLRVAEKLDRTGGNG